jgi:hypothetical protein
MLRSPISFHLKPETRTKFGHSRIRCNKDPEAPAREDALDLLECQLGLGFMAEAFDSLDTVTDVLLKKLADVALQSGESAQLTSADQ